MICGVKVVNPLSQVPSVAEAVFPASIANRSSVAVWESCVVFILDGASVGEAMTSTRVSFSQCKFCFQ